MAALGSAVTKVTTQQTTTSGTYGDVSGASIASGSFTAGKKYLILIQAWISNNTAANQVWVKALHGTTDFDHSEVGLGSDASVYLPYSFLTVWTAVSSEGIKLQFRNNAGGGTAQIDNITLMAVKLDDDLTQGTDWDWSEYTTSTGLTTTPQDGASVSITPGQRRTPVRGGRFGVTVFIAAFWILSSSAVGWAEYEMKPNICIDSPRIAWLRCPP